MSDADHDVVLTAMEYRDILKTELAKVERFLAIADELADSGEAIDSGFSLAAAAPPSATLH